MTKDNRRPAPINRLYLHPLYMGTGEGKPTTVIDKGVLTHYVGIGWISGKEATQEDYIKYPEVVQAPLLER